MRSPHHLILIEQPINKKRGNLWNRTLGFEGENVDPPARERLGMTPSNPGGTSGTLPPTPAVEAEGSRTTTPPGAGMNLPVAGSRFWFVARSDCSRFLILFALFAIFTPPATPTGRGEQGGAGGGGRGCGSGGDEVWMVTILGTIGGNRFIRSGEEKRPLHVINIIDDTTKPNSPI
jgi:hypothetical protein